MMRATAYAGLAAGVIVASGCGHKPPPEQPAPQPSADIARADSVAAANRALADSLARVRTEAERLARERAEQVGVALRSELTRVIHFEFDKAAILAEYAGVLSRKAAILAANPKVTIRVAGHCDERGSDEYNLALGNRRAATAQRFLEDHGIAGTRIDVVSYGKEQPLDPGHNETAWALNRRDEFEITAGSDLLTTPVTLR
jgi:peptidoglycan-associated lipoprotein